MISTNLVDIQQDRLDDIESKKSTSRWTTKLIHKLWNIIHKLWIHHNEVLHNTKTIYALSGLVPFTNSMTTDHEIDLDELPSVYFSYIHKSFPLLLSKSAQYLNIGFLIIRSAREACDTSILVDEVYTNEPMRA